MCSYWGCKSRLCAKRELIQMLQELAKESFVTSEYIQKQRSRENSAEIRAKTNKQDKSGVLGRRK